MRAASSALLTVALGALAAVPQAAAYQVNVQPAESRKLSAFIPKSTLPIPADGRLRILLADVPQQEAWIVAVVPGSTEQIQVAMAAIAFTETHGLAGVESVPESQVETGPGYLRLRGVSSLPGRLVIFVRAPARLRLTVEADGVPQVSVPISDGIAIRRGSVLEQKPKNFAQALALLHEHKDTDEPKRLRTGQYAMPISLLRRHLTRLVVPEFTGQEQESATIVLTIGQDGTVSSIQRLSGNEAFLSAVEGTVREWRFRPFLVGGTPVVAVAPVTFIYKDGRVISALTDHE